VVDYTHYLKGVPLFAALSAAHLERIANSARERTYEPGTPIISAGEEGQGFYLIVKGECVLESVENAGSDPGMVNEIVWGQLKHHAEEAASYVYGTFPKSCQPIGETGAYSVTDRRRANLICLLRPNRMHVGGRRRSP